VSGLTLICVSLYNLVRVDLRVSFCYFVLLISGLWLKLVSLSILIDLCLFKTLYLLDSIAGCYITVFLIEVWF